MRGPALNHDSLTWPNHPVERTAPSGSFFPCVRRCLGAAAHRKRSVSTLCCLTNPKTIKWRSAYRQLEKQMIV
jgi:hypothetical protein